MKFLSRLLGLLKKGQTPDGPQPLPEDIAKLRNVFRERYHNFKLLLSANNKALEIMADMEMALKGDHPFGMAFVRSHCTAVSANVYKIVTNLLCLAPGRYDELKNRFQEIQKDISEDLEFENKLHGSELVLPLWSLDRHISDQAGGKMASLGEIKKSLNLPVPDGFVITARAYALFMEKNGLREEINRLIQSREVDTIDTLFDLSSHIQQRITRAVVPDEIAEAIHTSFDILVSRYGSDIRVSMRSSALGEDESGLSFAGQYRSELNVSRDNLVDVYKEIVASKYGVPAMSYRFQRGIPDEEVAMCVGVLIMIDAAVGGVIYTRNPTELLDDRIHITATWGLPKSVVDGSGDTDLYVVARRPPALIQQNIAPKKLRFVCDPVEGVCREELTLDQATAACLSEENALSLSGHAVSLEEHFGSPQDIEWAIDHAGHLFLLQSRALQVKKEPILEETAQTILPEGSEILFSGGETASPGAGWGKTFVVQKDADALQFPDGAILVANQSRPRWAALLNRASAVVTEHGSAAGHLANVAREFEVPALFGVPRALDILASGTEVTVDATGKRILKGKVEPLLASTKPRPSLMQGSPIHTLLHRVSKHIIPLHLLNPDSPDFAPAACQTFHDITRFCHEKSVQEMFRFGKDHHFSERSSKRLKTDVPMQWWIINLDDAFKEEVEGEFIPLDSIICVPMRALWQGITAMPWEGPPQVDGRGFMSVLLEATTNPNLEPARASEFANKNYFMLSKHYLNLQSRFGFHFMTVESIVGPRPIENYIRFMFAGGAADYSRRIRRTNFIAEIMEKFDFAPDVREDVLIARLEELGQDIMEDRLRIVGHLLIHTRQLDMIMNNEWQVNYYRDKIINDIEVLREIYAGKN